MRKNLSIFFLVTAGISSTFALEPPSSVTKTALAYISSYDQHYGDTSWAKDNLESLTVIGDSTFPSADLNYFKDRKASLEKMRLATQGTNYFIGTPKILTSDFVTEVVRPSGKGTKPYSLWILRISYQIVLREYLIDGENRYGYDEPQEPEERISFLILAKDDLDGKFRVIGSFPNGGSPNRPARIVSLYAAIRAGNFKTRSEMSSELLSRYGRD